MSIKWIVWLVFGAILVVTLLLDRTFEGQTAESTGDTQLYQMSPKACEYYADDTMRFAVLRDNGVAQEEVVRLHSKLVPQWYSAEVWSYVVELIAMTYSTVHDPKDWSVMLYKNCMRLQGLKKLSAL